ncbi:hypothetical protein [Celeribacter halophilus]|uniref:hypothetical protein n=1 Tax=Celeribacter halophilus TaxID=576117 RepID=UPI001C0864EC|nr:hypothetical protein [Celeribacter halophilus]MBU2888822.1 hypothetical protein [Celeribacter halophilus]MDO6511819.1 hypothetical protein [Celeribacter halophilus]
MSEKRSHTSLMLLRFSKIECLKFFEKRFMIRKKNTSAQPDAPMQVAEDQPVIVVLHASWYER